MSLLRRYRHDGATLPFGDLLDEVWELDGAQVYDEKSWGRGGFPASWW